jgi:hypothetical protein
MAGGSVLSWLVVTLGPRVNPEMLFGMLGPLVSRARGQPQPRGSTRAEVIIGHVANSSLEHPLIHLPTIFGIDFSVTKHVFMLWLVAASSSSS